MEKIGKTVKIVSICLKNATSNSVIEISELTAPIAPIAQAY